MAHSADPPRRVLTTQLGALITTWWSDEYRKSALKSAGLSSNSTDTQVLWELNFSGPDTPSKLAARIGVGAPAITKAVARLEELSYVTKEQNLADLRSSIISITPQGEEIVDQILTAGDKMLSKILIDWSEDEISEFTSYVTRFTRSSLAVGKESLEEDLPSNSE